jgi:hypothetical protein
MPQGVNAKPMACCMLASPITLLDNTSSCKVGIARPTSGQPLSKSYSLRRVTAGSTRTARRAGKEHAMLLSSHGAP